MSRYSPDPGAIPNDTDFTAQLSQRDLALQVPINFVTIPSIALTPACFGHLRYEEVAGARCISNLLALGFRRLQVDLYWDVSRKVFSLCPVQLGSPQNSYNTTIISAAPPKPTSSASLTSKGLSQREADVTTSRLEGEVINLAAHHLREVSTPLNGGTRVSSASSRPRSTLTATAVMTANSSSTSLSTMSGTATAPAPTETLVQVGPFSCTPGANFDMVTDVLAGYLGSTENNLNATMHYLVINLHAAAPASDPAGSARKPSTASLPDADQSVGSLLVANNSAYLYTPPDLATGRADLNATGGWYDVHSSYRPASAYMTNNDFDGMESSPNGWPSEAYVELLKYRRLLAAFGRIDPQMQSYNFSGDSDYIFPSGYLTSQPDITLSASGHITSGCFFQPGRAEVTVSTANSSWSVHPVDSPQYLEQAGNLTACGISPLLNASTLVPNGASADVSYAAYADLVSAQIWSWDTGEPRGSPTSDVNGADSGAEWSCALLNATSGRWQAGDCTQSHYGACRVRDQPYEWDISQQKGSYYQVNAGCREGDDFAVPRTGLENSYLVNVWQKYISDHGDNDGDAMLWLDFNDLDVQGCWVIGQNTTCPYRTKDEAHHQVRKIIVPVVAAIIVFVLAALTMFVKCAANRRSTKRRLRRGTDGWDYEGVPS